MMNVIVSFLRRAREREGSLHKRKIIPSFLLRFPLSARERLDSALRMKELSGIAPPYEDFVFQLLSLGISLTRDRRDVI